jgi:magnesium chelatase subunit D
LLLPPTRSLARAKALLANLPGGGGTPLAGGLDCALLTALAERVKGHDPLIIIMTDGRANIDRSGAASRTTAQDQALQAAGQIAKAGIESVFVDVAPRPRDEAAQLAGAMAARYVALPYVEASGVREIALDAVRANRHR